MKNTYTLKECGCYGDSAKGIRLGTHIQKFAQEHGWKGEPCLTPENEEYDCATEEAIGYLNARYKVERAEWGYSENGDFGLWQYSFLYDELSDDAKEKVVQRFWDINVDQEWWQFVYDDAQQIGLQITGFDLDRNKHATGKLKAATHEVLELILKNHGEQTDTYKLALDYKTQLEAIKTKPEYLDPECLTGLSYEGEQAIEDLETQFEQDLLNEYADILQKEYDWRTSREQIEETIRANEYEFNEEGKLI